MSNKFIMFVVALLLIDAAILGNIGSILGAIIDPANMNDVTSTTSTSSTIPPDAFSNNNPNQAPNLPKSPTNTPGYYPPGTTIPQNI